MDPAVVAVPGDGSGAKTLICSITAGSIAEGVISVLWTASAKEGVNIAKELIFSLVPDDGRGKSSTSFLDFNFIRSSTLSLIHI